MSKNKCYECGMFLRDPAQWHPYKACEIFKKTHDSREVDKAIDDIQDTAIGKINLIARMK